MELLIPGIGLIVWSILGLLLTAFVLYFMVIAIRYMKMRLKEYEEKQRIS